MVERIERDCSCRCCVVCCEMTGAAYVDAAPRAVVLESSIYASAAPADQKSKRDFDGDERNEEILPFFRHGRQELGKGTTAYERLSSSSSSSSTPDPSRGLFKGTDERPSTSPFVSSSSSSSSSSSRLKLPGADADPDFASASPTNSSASSQKARIPFCGAGRPSTARRSQAGQSATMTKAALVLLGTIFLVCPDSNAAAPESIPIGSIYLDGNSEAKSAFQYAIMRHNTNDSKLGFNRFKLSGLAADAIDSFQYSHSLCDQMSKGIFAFYGLTTGETYSVASSYSKSLHMPFINPNYPRNISRVPYSRRKNGPVGFEINIHPSYSKAVLDLLIHYGWEKIYYLYDGEEAIIRLQALFRLISLDTKNKISIEVKQVLNTSDAKELLRSVDNDDRGEGAKRIILDFASRDGLEQVLDQIFLLGMHKSLYHYMIMGLNFDQLDLQRFKYGGVNITGFRIVDPNNQKVKTFLETWKHLDPKTFFRAGTRDITTEAALTIDSVAVIIRAFSAILEKNSREFSATFRRGKVYNKGKSNPGINCRNQPPDVWKHGVTIMRNLHEVQTNGLTGLIKFDKLGMRKNFTIDVMEISLNKGPTKMGSWVEGRGLQTSAARGRPGPISAMNKTRIVTSILTEPYLMEREKTDEGEVAYGNDRYYGYCADLVEKLAHKCGFDYVIKLVNDSKYGAQDEKTGFWNGMVGELTRNEADLAVAPLTITSLRERVIDFSKPFMSLGISIMIKKPEKQKPGVFSFMDPLSYEIWMCIIFAYIGVSVVLFLVSRFSPYEWRVEETIDGPSVTNDFTIFNSFWFSLGAFMQQGTDISPRSVSGRLVGSVWWFFTLIIISSYTANLAAFLTVERMLTPIEGADDLAKQTEIRYGSLDSGSTKEFFKTSKIAVYERMWAFMSTAQPNVFVQSTDEGVERVRRSKGKYAFLLESTMNDYKNERKPCNTMKVGSNLDSKGYGVATPLGSDLRDCLSYTVLLLLEGGDLTKLKTKWWYDRSECGKGEMQDGSQNALSLSNVAGVFYILIGGLTLAMVMALLEFCYKSRLENRRSKVRGGLQYQSYSTPPQMLGFEGFGNEPLGGSHTQV